MNHDSLSNSFDDENIISKASPKGYEQPTPSRSRFSILADMNEANISKKTEEQSLLSKYMKDLHDEQTQNQPNPRDCCSGDYSQRDSRKIDDRNREPNEYDWKRKSVMRCAVEDVENISKLSESSRCSSKQEPDSYGIFVYKMKIDLNKPIDFSVEDQENHHRNYGESRSSSKFLQKEKSQEDMLFGKALRQQHHRPKNARF